VVVASLVGTAAARPRPPTPTKPSVKLTKLDYGTLPPDGLDDDAELARHRSALVGCYKDALVGVKKPFTAKFDVTLKIKPNGSTGVQVGGQVAAAAEEAQQCIVSELRRIRFRAGAARTGTTTIALYLAP
jgi:hypothetical protein